MKNFVVIVVLIAGLVGGAYFWKQKQKVSEAAAGQTMAEQTLAPALSTNIDFAVTVAGEIGPAEQVSVRPEVNGRIKELPVDIGDHVKEHALLFALDDKDLQIELATRNQEIDSAKLQMDKAKLAMEQAERDYQRDKSLYDEKLVSEQVYESSKQVWESASKDFELAKNSVDRAHSNLEQTKEKLKKTRVEAPFDCTVLTRSVTGIGQAVSGSGGFNSGTEVMTIANLADLVILAHVNQADVTRLRNGMEVHVAVEAVPGLVVTGVVERISPQATIVNNIKGFDARIRLRSPDARIQPGMTANITIPVASASNVVAVPLAAVFTEFNPEKQQNERFVYVQDGQKFEKRPVQIGVADYFYAEVQKGVNPGDIVSLEKPAANKIVEAPPEQAESRPSGQASVQPRNT